MSWRINTIIVSVCALSLISSCSSNKRDLATIGSLKHQAIKLEDPAQDIPIDEAKVRQYYREFLSITNDYKLYSEALRRLADLQLKAGEEQLSEGSQQEAEQGQRDTQASIRLYTTYLETHPNAPNNDMILYQLAKAYELNGEPQKSLDALNRIIRLYPNTRHRDEVQFRRGEMLFLLRRYPQAESAYQSIITSNPNSVFYEKAVYKYGWTLYKGGLYRKALHSFFQIMDLKQQQGLLQDNQAVATLGRAEKELLADTLRAISLSFAYLYDDYPVGRYFRDNGARPYESLIYLSLGKHYLQKERIKDAADTFLAFVKRYPTSPLAPEFHTEAINAYEKGGLASLVLPAKEEFIRLYGVGSPYWNQQDQIAHDRIRPLLGMHITEVATYYHAAARKSKKPQDFLRAADWYGIYVKTFPKVARTGKVNFLMAEALFDGRYYDRAAAEYERTAYEYPRSDKSAEAGYAAILSYNEIEKRVSAAQFTSWRPKAIEAAIKFGNAFPNDPRVTPVLTKTAEQLYADKDYLRAASLSQQVMDKNPKDSKIQRTALIVLGHSEFELKNYAQAEGAYRRGLRLISPKDKQYRGIYDRIAASIYKQGEAARDAGQMPVAISHFLRIKDVTPKSELRANAEFDAAAAMIENKQYNKAAAVLENFRKEFPKHKLQSGINEKLALIYSETGQSGRAAREMEQLSYANRANPKYSGDLLWQSGLYYEKAKANKDAERVFGNYIKTHPQPFERSLEARHKMAEYARRRGDSKSWGVWLQDIIRADARGGTQRTDRTRYLAADATLKLADGHYNVYKRSRLGQPLKQTLNRKKTLMQNAINAYQTAIKYRVAEVTTSATYKIGSMYNDFAKSLLAAPAPASLKGEAREQYKILLEEQAFPFEEKAIDIHVANIKQIAEGNYDEWVERSLNTLRKLQPGRYAKDERTEAYVEFVH